MADESEAAVIDLDLFNAASAKAEEGGLESLTDTELLALANGYGFLHNQALRLLRERAAARGAPPPAGGRMH